MSLWNKFRRLRRPAEADRLGHHGTGHIPQLTTSQRSGAASNSGVSRKRGFLQRGFPQWGFFQRMREVWQWCRRRWRTMGPWIVVGLCWLIPLVVLIVVGSYRLYLEGWLLAWFVGATISAGLGWGIAWLMLRKKVTFPGPEVQPALDWPPRGVAAWAEVEKLAEEAENSPPSYNDWEGWRQLVTRVLETVARHYYPEATAPLLEVSVPRILRIIELVARDFRRTISEHIPLADRLTVGDLQRAYYLQGVLGQLYRLYRIFAVGINPMVGGARFIRDLALQGLQETTADALLRWAAKYVVQRTGYYAIMLYGGYMIPAAEELSEYQSVQSRREIAEGFQELAQIKSEPLRILILGRKGAGKSSVINAFSDRPVAPPGVSCRRFTSYPLPPAADGLPKLAIECPGSYLEQGSHAFRSLWDRLFSADVLVLVVRVDQADWKPERLFLETLRQEFLQHPDYHLPPILVVGTRTDCLEAEDRREPQDSGKKAGYPGGFVTVEVARVHNQLKADLGGLSGGPVIVGCFKAPIPPEVRAVVEGAWTQVEDFARVVHLARVRRSLNQFNLWRDVVKPVSTTMARMFSKFRGMVGGQSEES